MDHAGRVDAVERELGSLVAAVDAGSLDAPVPTCPDFTVDDLAQHVGSFCGFWTHILCEGSGRPKTPFDAVGPEGRAVWLRTLGGHLVAELRATPPDTVVWTWHAPDQSAAFVGRRTSHELAIHRVDAQLARGSAGPVDAELAADGIEEVFLLATSPAAETRVRSAATTRAEPRRTLHLHGTDYEPSEWFLTLGPDGMQVTREHAKGDLALKGTVSDLEMLLYQRPTVGQVDRFGDESVLDDFHREFTFI